MFTLHTSALDINGRNVSENFIMFYRPTLLMKEIPEEDFILHVQLTLDAFSTGDLNIIKDFKNIFIEIMGTEYFLKIIIEVTPQLKEVSPEIKLWIQEYLSKFS